MGHLLPENDISAVVVVSDNGVVSEIVSECDLSGLPPRRLARRDWSVAGGGGGQRLDEDFLVQVNDAGRTMRDVMTAPPITVSVTTGLRGLSPPLVTGTPERNQPCPDGRWLPHRRALSEIRPVLPVIRLDQIDRTEITLSISPRRAPTAIGQIK